MTGTDRLAALIERLARLDAAGARSDGLNPVQRAALGYLAAANRLSRSPSHVAEYLGTTRGTMSQTLLTLAERGHLEARPDPADRRAVRWDLTAQGREAAGRAGPLARALSAQPGDAVQAAETALAHALATLIAANGGRSFGVCRTCRHHAAGPGGGGHCRLLGLDLAPEEADLLCHEHAA